MQERIFEYIRNRKGKRIGVLLGTVVDNQIVYGFSQANIKSGDEFDKEYGKQLAFNRAIGAEPITPAYTIEAQKMVNPFTERCIRYFKQAELLSLVGHFCSSKD